MLPTRLRLAIVLLPAFLPAWGQTTGQPSTLTTGFVIDDSRPYVYLAFDRIGSGVRFSDDEPAQRIWLRFVNNCRVGVVLRTFGAPEGSLKGEVGVMHEVVKERKSEHRLALSTKSSEPRPDAKMPTGYDSDVSSAEIIPPGDSVLFSVPVTHLSKYWHIEIPYEFDVPSGKGSLKAVTSGIPRMAMLYYIWDLPEDLQQQLLKTR